MIVGAHATTRIIFAACGRRFSATERRGGTRPPAEHCRCARERRVAEGGPAATAGHIDALHRAESPRDCAQKGELGGLDLLGGRPGRWVELERLQGLADAPRELLTAGLEHQLCPGPHRGRWGCTCALRAIARGVRTWPARFGSGENQPGSGAPRSRVCDSPTNQDGARCAHLNGRLSRCRARSSRAA
eukprot:5975507-Prymnesium_polylepis.1